MDGMEHDAQLEHAQEQHDANDESQLDDTNLIINYLPYDMNERELKELFDSYGEVIQVKVVKSKATNMSVGYGFVRFTTPAAALKAIAGANGLQVRNKRIKVSLARKSSAAIVRSNLYVAGIPLEYDEVALQNLFKPYGQTIETKILRDHATGQSRGAGFVRFSLNSEAQNAIAALNGYVIPGKNTTLTVKFADDGQRNQQQQFPMPLSMPNYNMSSNMMAGGYGRGPQYGHMQSPMMGHFQMPYGQQGARMGRGRGMQPYANGNMQRAGATPGNTWCLFVYNLPPHYDDTMLYNMFASFGHVTNAKIQRDPATRASRGFGFVNYPDYQQAQMAIQAMNGFQLGDKYLQVSFKTQKQY